MPKDFHGRTFLTESEAASRLGFDAKDIPPLSDERTFFYRGMAEPKPARDTRSSSNMIFVEGFFYSPWHDGYWNDLEMHGTCGMVSDAYPCCAVVDGKVINFPSYFDAMTDLSNSGFGIEIRRPVSGPIYYATDTLKEAAERHQIPWDVAPEASPPEPRPEMDKRERRTLLRIIKALALEAKLPLDTPHKAAALLELIASTHGVPFPRKTETVAGKLEQARDTD